MIVPRFNIDITQAYHALTQLEEARRDHPELCIPMLIIPATISNNVPGTDMSIGCDTALNAVCEVGAFHIINCRFSTLELTRNRRTSTFFLQEFKSGE